ncbi:hypothetical protein BGX34_008461, partial [Mortierella sp. NVP85]
RLGEIAANTVWDEDIRLNAIAFLGEIYRGDAVWGQQPSIKQLIVNIIMQLATSENALTPVIEPLLQDLSTNGDAKKQALYRKCKENGIVFYPLKGPLPELASPSLLDRVQNRPDVDGNIRLLKKQRTQDRGKTGTKEFLPP